MAQDEKTLPIYIKKAEDFKIICMDGAYGTLDGLKGFVGIYTDIIEQEVDYKGIVHPVSVTRTIHAEIRMNPEIWIALAQWMYDNAEGLKKFRQDELDKLLKEKLDGKK